MRKSIILSFVLIAGVVAAAPRLFKRAWRPPQRDTDRSPADFGLPGEEMWISGVRSLQLHAWLVPVAGVAPAVIVLHGWGGNAADMLELAPALHDAGFHAFFLDARNHGLSEHDDHVSMLRFAEDLGAGVDYLHGRSDVTDVAVIGHSVGAAAAIYRASYSDGLSAVVAVASFAHPGDLMNANLPLPRPVRWAVLAVIQAMIGKRFDDIAPRSRITHVSIPVLFIHGEDDAVVPVEEAYELSGLLPQAELVIVPDAGHSDLTLFAPFFPKVVAFLTSHLGSDATR
ncbi:MAG: alpha/beta fold hydrolase [Actinomycetota bacterium]|nr:alpha/beta fold hydrolase [Actinomycetota bacterium]